MSTSGKAKVEFCRSLSTSWRELADYIAIDQHEIERFERGEEARCIWNWAHARRRLAELAKALHEIGRDDLVALFQESVDGQDCGAPMDPMEKAALIDRAEQYRTMIQAAFREQRQTAFIIAADQAEWPESLAYKLSYDTASRLFAPPIFVTDMPGPGSDPVELLYRSVGHRLLVHSGNGTTFEALRAQVREELRRRSRTQVVYTKIARDTEWEPEHLLACFDAWEREMTWEAPTAHYLLFIVEERPPLRPPPRKPRARLLQWFSTSSPPPRTFLETYLEKLEEHDLGHRCLCDLGSPCLDHVHTWIDRFLHHQASTYQKEKLRQRAREAFEQRGLVSLPHRDLGLLLADLLPNA